MLYLKGCDDIPQYELFELDSFSKESRTISIAGKSYHIDHCHIHIR